MWEITFIETGITEQWSTRKCNKYFGKAEFSEICQGYHPSIVAARIR